MNLRRSSQARVGRIRNLNSHRRMGLFGLSRYFESLEDRLALSAAPIQVTTTADVVDPNDGLTSLREAIDQANAAATPQTIVLPAGHYQLSAAAGELEISSSVTIAGADAMSTIVDGGGQVRVFHIDGSDTTVSFSGLTIQGGNASGNGGGILDTATASHLTLTDCMVNGNAASGDGGAIDEAAGTSTFTLNGCTIANNTSGGNGGGIEIASTQTTAPCRTAPSTATRRPDTAARWPTMPPAGRLRCRMTRSTATRQPVAAACGRAKARST